MPREYFLPAPRGGKVSKVSRGKRPWVEKWWRDVKGTEIKSASPLFSSWRRHREDKSGGEDRSRREMETLGIRRPGKIPSTIRTFNRASRGKEGGESWMATLNRASSRRRTARMHLSLSLSPLLLRHLSAISSFPRFLPPLRLSATASNELLTFADLDHFRKMFTSQNDISRIRDRDCFSCFSRFADYRVSCKRKISSE